MAVTGRLNRVSGPLVEIEGLDRVAVMDVVEIGDAGLTAEVVAVRPGRATAQVYDYTGGLSVGVAVEARGNPLSARLGPGLLGGAFDGLLRRLDQAGTWLDPGWQITTPDIRWRFTPVASTGQTMGPGEQLGSVPTSSGVDHRVLVPPGTAGQLEWISPEASVTEEQPVARIGGREIALTEWWPVRRARPYTSRQDLTVPLITGQRVIDLLYPVAKGGTAAVPGGFGTGKTVLLQQIVKWCRADVIVFVGCGERGNELADALSELAALDDPLTGRRLLERTVVIANTSNMPVMAREASIYTGMTVAEYYRDMGYDAVLLADSTSRWAEALREFSSRNGELPVEEGYPAVLPSALAAFYERAGRVVTTAGREGSVTVIGAVSPPGGDMTEPVSAHTERFVRCLWSLDRDLAYSRHYPAVSWHRSFSRDAAGVASWYSATGRVAWGENRQRATALLAEADRVEPVADLVGVTGLPDRERLVLLGAGLIRSAVLQQNATSPNDASCSPDKQSALIGAALAVYDRAVDLLGRGVRASAIEQVDLSTLVRAASGTGPDDATGVIDRTRLVLADLDALAEV